MISVSIILPVYNGAQTLSITLESLLAQTFEDFELIACIDGGNDDSEAILSQYSKRFKKLTILKNDENKGLGPTLNRLVFHSKGDYIAIAEQDDYYYPERLEQQVKILNSDQTIGLVSGIAEFWNGNDVSTLFPGILVNGNQYPEGADMFKLNYINQIKVVNSCMMFRKSVHIENGLYFTKHYPSISVDWTYILRFSLVSKIHGIHKVLVRLDRRPERDSVTSNKLKQFSATRELLRSMAYEYQNIITNADYKIAMRTQNVMEINSKSGLEYLLVWLKYFLMYPFEKRYIRSMSKRIHQKLKLLF